MCVCARAGACVRACVRACVPVPMLVRPARSLALARNLSVDKGPRMTGAIGWGLQVWALDQVKKQRGEP